MESFAEISRGVFRDYVRSAVIIDDQWPEYEIVISDDEADESHLLVEEVEDDGTVDTVDAGLTGKVPERPKSRSAEEVDAEILGKLRHALLREGVLTCGLRYQQQDRKTAIKLARQADIVVLDWDLVSDDGAEALLILKELGDALRFVCIFTGRGRPDEVKKRIESLGSTHSRQEEISPGQENADFRLGNLVIAIRVKENSEKEPDLAVDPDHLLEAAIAGLVRNFGGLVQLAMLEMTHRHREHLPKILTRIGHLMDTAVLFEAGNEDSPVGDAFLGVLVDEWRSHLEQDHAHLRSLSQKGRRAFGEKLWDMRSEIWSSRTEDQLLGLGATPSVAKKYAQTMPSSIEHWIANGCEGETPKGEGVSRRLAAWTALHSTTDSSDPSGPLLQLDTLFHQQLNPTNALTQGTVVLVNDGGAHDYLICTTPLCDADRPKKIGGLFTFVRTRVVRPEEILRGGDATSYCVVKRTHEREHLCLAILIKERVTLEVWNQEFGDDNKAVYARLSLGGGPEEKLDSTRNDVTLYQVAQLRLEHALALSAASAADASRIGVNRVELIRSRVGRARPKK